MAVDPIERKRRLLSGDLDPLEVRQRKVEAMRRAHAVRSQRKALDPVEAKRQALARKAAERRARARPKALPSRLVVLVRPRPAGPAPPPPAEPDPEAEIARRLAEARRRLEGGRGR